MTATEKNKMIMEFMGWELKRVNNPSEWAFVNKNTGETIRGVYNDSVMNFTSDWNLLIQVINKLTDSEENAEDISDEVCEQIKLINESKGEK
jgi:hypothetical protein